MKFFLYLIIICLSGLIISCSYAPTQHYLKSGEISKFNKIALNVVTTEINVKYESATNMELLAATPSIIAILFPLPTVLITSSIEGITEGIEDSEITSDIRVKRGTNYYDTMLKESFLEQIRQAKFEEIIDYSDVINQQELSQNGYDALILLEIEDLILKESYSNNMNIYTRVVGKIIDIKNDKEIWYREEFQQGEGFYSIAEFKADNGMKTLSTIEELFNKISNRLVIDIFYN